MSIDSKIYGDFQVELFFSDDARGINLDLRKIKGLIEVEDLIYVLKEITKDFETANELGFDEDEPTFRC